MDTNTDRIKYGKAALSRLPEDTSLPYNVCVEIEFDTDKDKANRRKHGVSLAAAGGLLVSPCVIEIDDRFQYDEERLIATGLMGGCMSASTRCAETLTGLSRYAGPSGEKLMPIVKVTLADSQEYIKNHDWTASDAMTDEDIAHQIAENPDAAPDMTEKLLRRRARAVDVAALRKRLEMTQAEFARAYRFSIGAVRDMEQGRRTPSGPAAALLELIDADPDYVRRRLAGAAGKKGRSSQAMDTNTK